MKKLILAGASLAAIATMPMSAQAQDSSVDWSLGVDYVTQYVFRGASLADDAIQPYVEATAGNFTIGAWASTGVGENSVFAGDEIDLYAGYSVPLDGAVSLDLGATYYHYPQSGDFFQTKDGGAGSYEASVALGFGEVALAPSIAAYYDLTLDQITLEGSVGHSVEIGEKASLDLGLTAGLTDGDIGDWEWATASAAISKPLRENVAGYIGVNYSLNSEDLLNFGKGINGNAKDNLLWMGVGVSTDF